MQEPTEIVPIFKFVSIQSFFNLHAIMGLGQFPFILFFKQCLKIRQHSIYPFSQTLYLFPNLKIEKIAKIGKLVFWTLFGKKEAGCERSKCLDGVREKVYSIEQKVNVKSS